MGKERTRMEVRVRFFPGVVNEEGSEKYSEVSAAFDIRLAKLSGDAEKFLQNEACWAVRSCIDCAKQAGEWSDTAN